MSFYPYKVQRRFDAPRNVTLDGGANAESISASFDCGSFVAFTLRIDTGSKIVTAAAFRTNGCGYMVAAADVLADAVAGCHLAELHGLDENELQAKVAAKLDTFPDDRTHCIETCIEALRAAFADYRIRQIEEFQGETALICTCFGVSEATIELLVVTDPPTTVEKIAQRCNAGSGCGSCRMLIQEIIDAHF